MPSKSLSASNSSVQISLCFGGFCSANPVVVSEPLSATLFAVRFLQFRFRAILPRQTGQYTDSGERRAVGLAKRLSGALGAAGGKVADGTAGEPAPVPVLSGIVQILHACDVSRNLFLHGYMGNCVGDVLYAPCASLRVSRSLGFWFL